MSDFEVVRETANESAIWRSVRWAGLRASAAWQESVTQRRLQSSIVEGVAASTVRERVQHAALVVAVAGVVNVGLLSFAGAYASPGIPRAVVALAALIAAIVAVAPDPFLAAWPASLAGRAASRVRRFLQTMPE